MSSWGGLQRMEEIGLVRHALWRRLSCFSIQVTLKAIYQLQKAWRLITAATFCQLEKVQYELHDDWSCNSYWTFSSWKKVAAVFVAAFVCGQFCFGRYGLLCGGIDFFFNWKYRWLIWVWPIWVWPIWVWPNLSVVDFDLADIWSVMWPKWTFFNFKKCGWIDMTEFVCGRYWLR